MPKLPVDRRLQKTRRKKQQKGAVGTFGPRYLRKGSGGIYTRDERKSSRRKPGPKTEKRRRMPIKKQIEATQGITEREFIWTKDRAGNLKQFKKITGGGKESAYFNFADIPKADFLIHNHPNTPMITPPDIETLSRLMRSGKAKTGAVAAMGKTGKVKGYTVFKLNKPWPKKAAQKIIVDLMELIKPYMDPKGPRPPKDLTAWKFINQMRAVMKPHGVELNVRFAPAKGFEFSNERRRFVRNRPKNSQAS